MPLKKSIERSKPNMTDYKESKEELELSELFEGNSPSNISKVVSKAKRRTVLRTIAISSLVVVFLSITLGFTWLSLMRWSEEKAIRDIELFSWITDPNVEELGVQTEGNGLFEGIITFNRYKEIEGIPVNWSDDVFTYSLFGGVSRLSGDHSPIQIQDKNDGQMRHYDRVTKQRMMRFYHPEVRYSEFSDDLAILSEFADDTLVEMALSFDRKYSPEEVREGIPEGITLKWHWVDTYSKIYIDGVNAKNIEMKNGDTIKMEASPERAIQIYGFEDSSESEQRFIQSIEKGLRLEAGKYFGEYERIHHNMKGDSSTLTADNLNIIGAVVTGTAQELTALEDVDMIRASVLGVTANPNK